MNMDPSVVARRLVREQYVAVRQALTLLEERVLARYWDQDTPVRAGFERFLGSMDEAAGRFLDDEELARQGEDLRRRTRSGAAPGPQAPPEPEPEATAPAPPAPPAPAEPEATTPAPPAPPEPEATTPAPPAPAAGAGTVDVVFTLPAEVKAGRVALCGEFNDWATDSIVLERGADGTWRVTVALEPGRSYRYRYLLDGERWENSWQADRYVPNSYGSVDSVVVVE